MSILIAQTIFRALVLALHSARETRHDVFSRINLHHIPDFRTSNTSTLEKFRTTKDRMLLPELNQPSRKLEQLILFLVPLPIDPTDLIVLAVGVIVAALRSTPLVPAV